MSDKKTTNLTQSSVSPAKNFLIFCYLAQTVSSIVWTIWSCNKIYNDDQKVFFQTMSATQYAYLATTVFTFTSIVSRTASIYEYSPTASTAETVWEKRLFYAISIPLNIVIGAIKAYSIFIACIDPKDSLIALGTDNKRIILGIGSILGLFSAIGSFASDFTFYFRPVGNSAVYFKRELEKSSCREKLKIFLITLSYHLPGAIAYSLYYQMYFIESLKTTFALTNNDLTLKANSSIIATTSLVIFFAILRNFFSNFEKMSSPKKLLQIQEKGRYRYANSYGIFGMLIGFFDAFFTAYSAWIMTYHINSIQNDIPAIATGALTTLTWYARLGSIIYGLQYFALSIVQGTARALDVYGSQFMDYAFTPPSDGYVPLPEEEYAMSYLK